LASKIARKEIKIDVMRLSAKGKVAASLRILHSKWNPNEKDLAQDWVGLGQTHPKKKH
jgi:hypothetical protein